MLWWNSHAKTLTHSHDVTKLANDFAHNISPGSAAKQYFSPNKQDNRSHHIPKKKNRYVSLNRITRVMIWKEKKRRWFWLSDCVRLFIFMCGGNECWLYHRNFHTVINPESSANAVYVFFSLEKRFYPRCRIGHLNVYFNLILFLFTCWWWCDKTGLVATLNMRLGCTHTAFQFIGRLNWTFFLSQNLFDA